MDFYDDKLSNKPDVDEFGNLKHQIKEIIHFCIPFCVCDIQYSSKYIDCILGCLEIKFLSLF